MAQHSPKRWFTGAELITRWGIMDFEIFDLLKLGGLQPHTSLGKKVIDADSLPRERKDSLEWISRNLKAGRNGRNILGGPRPWMPFESDDELMRQAREIYWRQPLEMSKPPEDCVAMSFTLPTDQKQAAVTIAFFKGCLFKTTVALEFERQHSLGSSPAQEVGCRATMTEHIACQFVTHDVFQNPDLAEGVKEGPHEKEQQGESDVPVINFYRNGDYWIIGQPGKEKQFKNLNGFKYIMYLLQHPNVPIPCISLYHDLQEMGEKMPLRKGSIGTAEPERTLSAGRDLHRDHSFGRADRNRFEARIKEIDGELDSCFSSERPDEALERKEGLQREKQDLVRYLRQGVRKTGQDENARTNVRQAIKAALVKMSNHKGLAALLNNQTVATGHDCQYTPGSSPPQWVTAPPTE
jgi:hypothetical protein